MRKMYKDIIKALAEAEQKSRGKILHVPDDSRLKHSPQTFDKLKGGTSRLS
jgi:hypothetical protein